MKAIFDLLARVFLATIFFYEAADTIWYFEDAKQVLVEYGITFHPNFILVGLIFLLVLGATLVLIGYLATLGSLLLLIYLVPFTFIVYSFWNDPAEVQRIHAQMFMRNMAIAGGLLLLIVNGAGKYSIKRLIHVMKLPR